MKRNKESKARQRIICENHLDKRGQRDLDRYVNSSKIRCAELITMIRKGAVFCFLTSNAFRRCGKALTEGFAEGLNTSMDSASRACDGVFGTIRNWLKKEGAKGDLKDEI